MSPETVQEMIRAVIPDADITMDGQDCNFSVSVSSAEFAGKSRIQCHRMVNDIFKAQIASGELHALSIKTQVK